MIRNFSRPTASRKPPARHGRDHPVLPDLDDAVYVEATHVVANLYLICGLLEKLWEFGDEIERHYLSFNTQEYLWSLVMLEGACRGLGAILSDSSRLSRGDFRRVWTVMRNVLEREVFLENLRLPRRDWDWRFLDRSDWCTALRIQLHEVLWSLNTQGSKNDQICRDLDILWAKLEEIRVRFVDLIVPSARSMAPISLREANFKCDPLSPTSTHDIECLFGSLSKVPMAASCSFSVAVSIQGFLNASEEDLRNQGFIDFDADMIIHHASPDGQSQATIGAASPRESGPANHPLPANAGVVSEGVGGHSTLDKTVQFSKTDMVIDYSSPDDQSDDDDRAASPRETSPPNPPISTYADGVSGWVRKRPDKPARSSASVAWGKKVSQDQSPPAGAGLTTTHIEKDPRRGCPPPLPPRRPVPHPGLLAFAISVIPTDTCAANGII